MGKLIQSGQFVKVLVPSGSYLSVYSEGGQVDVYSTAKDGALKPKLRQFVKSALAGVEEKIGPTTDDTYYEVNNRVHPSDVYYDIGTSPSAKALARVRTMSDPTALTGVTTLTAAMLQNEVITLSHTTGGTVALTLPTGAVLDAALSMNVNDYIEWLVINTSAAAADTGTITASTGHTIVGTAVVPSAHSTTGALYGNAVRFRTRKTAASTFVTYRAS